MKKKIIDENTFIDLDTREKFKQNKEFPTYWAGDQGNIYSTKSHKCLSNRRKNKEGYVRITLPDGRQTTAHRFICLTWNGIAWPEARGYVVHHLNGSKSDNQLINLQLTLAEAHDTNPVKYWIYFDIQDFSDICRQRKKNIPVTSVDAVAERLGIDNAYQLRKKMTLWESQNGYALYRVDGHEEVIFTEEKLKV